MRQSYIDSCRHPIFSAPRSLSYPMDMDRRETSVNFLTLRAHSIKLQNMKEPFVVFYTPNIASESLNSLHSLGIETMPINRIDTPFLSSHKAAKFQYTRINLWAMTNYTTLVSLDLDTVVLQDISELFRCGSFCVSMRHSDKFNNGVMVLKPNRTIFDDMISKYSRLPSYDGGDQGFMNSYFSEIKYSSMFNPNDPKWPNRSDSTHTLSMAYNYDVGAYYLQSRLLLEPKIIHYTLGPTKPWYWWTYPMFNLNWIWQKFRLEVEKNDDKKCSGISVLATETMILLSLTLAYKVIVKCIRLPSTLLINESFALYFLLQLCSVALSFISVPVQRSLFISWLIFTINQLLFLLFFAAIGARITNDTTLNTKRVVQFIIIFPTTVAIIWFVLDSISIFSQRCLMMFVLVPLWFLLVNLLLRRLSFVDDRGLVRYEPMKTT
ncbi:Glycogenin-1 [Toxocara canis]|uniref:Glycogenin-1 n=1 Tax=Toxocara canis TaxID=6265 RepID=A0A0B2VN86_TOXCA|nr:Glycogenin-1 [Toxocara canis]